MQVDQELLGMFEPSKQSGTASGGSAQPLVADQDVVTSTGDARATVHGTRT